ncbi:DUF1289 domain-containing protein [Paracoccus sp. (in: a-proteobacteria)]|uniref:DUF1289 domain-containing protein n=1 Tax=Paracoccus sp. TaxID=267 RepID=UPI0026E0CEC6|nr:DUF1289 domain-containing protein [Paracoccus sp. (in: a-proteobacteria)]MDO5646740.1 DUF1289 domain-containing protein [Paracoccus sp. (in: a-proteobacteria)]
MPGIASPCINVCRIEPASGLCIGCWRSLDEITAWRDLTDDQRRDIIEAVDQRRETARQLPRAARGAVR